MNWWVAMDAPASATSQGYDDWYLPSLEELSLMYYTIGQGADNSGNFVGGTYWSSSESSNYNASIVYFYSGATNINNKNNTARVRVIRAF
jgi:hypothetical protein